MSNKKAEFEVTFTPKHAQKNLTKKEKGPMKISELIFVYIGIFIYWILTPFWKLDELGEKLENLDNE